MRNMRDIEQIVYRWWQSAATDGWCEQNTLTRLIFSCFTAHISMWHVTLAQDVCPHHVIHASCAVIDIYETISCDRKDNKVECLKECRICEDVCKKIWNWSMVFHWTRFWEKVVSFREQSTRSLGPCCGRHVTEIRSKWTSYFPFNDSIFQRKVEK